MVYKSEFVTQPVRETDRRAIRDHDRVRLLAPLTVEGRFIPEGATGSVVMTYEAGAAFEVEFTAPIHAVVGVPRERLQRL
jgi:hypothetical protein